MIGRKSTDFLTEASRADAVEWILSKFFETGKIDSADYDFVQKNGEVIPVLLSAIVQYTPEGEY